MSEVRMEILLCP